VVLNQHIDATSPTGRLVFHILGRLDTAHAGVCRKLTGRCVCTNAKCSAALIGPTVRPAPATLR
jgi:hypothetical protein